MKKIVIQGLGFVGSAMATAISSKLDVYGNPKFNVIGVDLDNKSGSARIDSINKGKFPFNTKDKKLQNELKKSVDRGNLEATTNNEVYSSADVIIVSINCDLINIDGHYQIALNDFVDSLKIIAEQIRENTLLIIESTVPPGTCQKLIQPIFISHFQDKNLDVKKFYLAHSYERVMPGDQYYDSIVNFWRVYSGINEHSKRKCEEFLSQIINVEKFPLTKLENITSSEIGKLLENSYRAVNIAFMEEWGRFAEDAGVDLYDIIDAIKVRPTHSNMMQPGFGVGGYCLTKDPLFAKIASKEILNLKGHTFPFSTQAVKINNEMPLVTLNKIKNYFKGSLNRKKILLMGVAYRKDVSDTRFSPSEKFVIEAENEGAIVDVYDPLVDYWNELNKEVIHQLPSSSKYDSIIFAVPHEDFSGIVISDWVKTNDTLIFDANNVLNKNQFLDIKRNKLNYISIGRG